MATPLKKNDWSNFYGLVALAILALLLLFVLGFCSPSSWRTPPVEELAPEGLAFANGVRLVGGGL